VQLGELGANFSKPTLQGRKARPREHATHEQHELSGPIEVRPEEVILNAGMKILLNGPIRQPREVLSHSHPDLIVRQQIDDPEPVEACQLPDAFRLRKRVRFDDLANGPIVQCVNPDEQQRRVGDKLFLLIPRQLGRTLGFLSHYPGQIGDLDADQCADLIETLERESAFGEHPFDACLA